MKRDQTVRLRSDPGHGLGLVGVGFGLVLGVVAGVVAGVDAFVGVVLVVGGGAGGLPQTLTVTWALKTTTLPLLGSLEMKVFGGAGGMAGRVTTVIPPG